jgi:hypothetical protein
MRSAFKLREGLHFRYFIAKFKLLAIGDARSNEWRRNFQMMRLFRNHVCLVLSAAILALPPVGMAAAQSDVRIDRVKIGDLELHEVEVTGASLSPEEIAAIFDVATSKDRRSELVNSLTASSVSIAQIDVRASPIGPMRIGRMHAEGLGKGKIRRLDLGSGQGGSSDGRGLVFYRWGSLAMEGVEASADLSMAIENFLIGDALRVRLWSWNDLEANYSFGAAPASSKVDDLVHLRIRALEGQSTGEDDIVTEIGLAIRNFVTEFPKESDQAKKLAELGYELIDVTQTFNMSFNPATKGFKFNDITLSAVGMGSISLRVELGNIYDARNSQTNHSALADADFIGAELDVINEGLFEKSLSLQTKKQGKSPDQFKAELKAGLTQGIRLFLGGVSSSADLSTALEKFIETPKSLFVAAKAKDVLKLRDMLGGSALAVLPKMEIIAKANESR